jgi:hypothetical protein
VRSCDFLNLPSVEHVRASADNVRDSPVYCPEPDALGILYHGISGDLLRSTERISEVNCSNLKSLVSEMTWSPARLSAKWIN